MLLFVILIQISKETITYDSQAFTQFSYTESGFNCENGYTKTNVIPFTNTFQTAPQIIFYFTTLDYNFSGQTEVDIELLSVTQTDFTLKIKCPYNKVNSYRIQWFAIDDHRLQVITVNKQIPFTSKQYPIQNPNLKKRSYFFFFVFLQWSIQYRSFCKITEITSNYVTVGMNSDCQNLISVSYQIILGTEEFLTLLDQTSSSIDYNSQQFDKLANNYFVIAYMQFTTSLLNIRYRITLSSTSTQISYATQSWSTNTYPMNKIQPYFLKYGEGSILLAMECFTARISKLFDMTADQKPAFQMKILEINKLYNSIGSETVVFGGLIQIINIQIYYKCPSNNKKVHSEINKCNTCSGSNKIYNLNHFCHGSINSINIYAKYQAQANNKELQITLTSNSISIVQTLRNQIVTVQNILKVEFLDI
ncbi:unnamed protein product [Paramecium sonneborni]|uniref:H-type lectin domain-containing protein n=1 Tax=Paramecium sonneborni TaxID=65129 RepID=A0A8S1RLY9_9CILI|nr:unnamed protein product [Paramecium sonneborni]